MAIQFSCPQCGKAMQAKEEHAGRQVKCPACGAAATVPYPSTPAGPPSPGAMAPAPMYQPPPVSAAKTSGLAIAALIFGLIPCTWVVGVILGIIALVSLRGQSGRGGHGLATTGIVLGGVWGMISIVALLISILLPGLGQAREAARRAKCMANLRGLAKTLMIYAQSNNDNWPAVAQGYTIEMQPTDVPEALDTQASLWLLLNTHVASAEPFICPSDDGAMAYSGPTGMGTAAFPNVSPNGSPGGGLRSWSYSYQIPQGLKGRPGNEVPNATRFAVMADRAPFAGDLLIGPGWLDAGQATDWLKGRNPTDRRRVNSPNHRGDGQNVLFRDGHVTWQANPWCGVNGDNIYTRATGQDFAEVLAGESPAKGGAVTVGPYSDDDSVLCNVLYGRPAAE